MTTTRLAHSTAVDLSLLIVRLACGIIFIAHGGQKMFGLWGGGGLAETVGHMGQLGYLVAFGEFFGGVALIVGLLSRFSAFWLIVIMLGAIVQVHGANGLLLANKGFEYNLALIGLCAPTLLAGPGRYSLAAAIRKLPKWLE
ncbi:MAG: DoxX family protein [bacterium]|nr:DoxX family protein [bacterium]